MKFFSEDVSIKILGMSLGLMIVGIVIFLSGYSDKRIMSQPSVDIYEVDDWSTLEEGTHVTFDLKMVWDEFYSAVETKRTMGIKTSERETGRGYMIPHVVYNSTYNDYEITGFLGTQVSDYTVFNQMIAESTEWYGVWMNGYADPYEYCKTTYKIDGKLKKMSKEDQELMIQYLMSTGQDRATAESYLVPFMIVNIKDTTTPVIMGIVVIIVGAVILAAYIITKKKKDNSDYYGASITPTVTNTDSTQYYGPEGLASEAQQTYKYGGTNTYGTSDIYSSSYTGSGSQVDSTTGLSADFLQREQVAKAERAREEANQRAMAANAAAYAANPLFGNEPAQKPVTASQSFSSYNQVVNPATVNQNYNSNNSGLAVDRNVLYGSAPAQPTFAQAPPVQESYLGGTPVQPAYSQPVQPTFTQAPPVQESYLGGSLAAQQTMFSPVNPVAPNPLVNSAPVQLPSGNGQYADNPGNKNYL